MLVEPAVLVVVGVLLSGVVYFGFRVLQRLNQVTATLNSLQNDASARADVLTANGTFTYRPNAGFTGTDTFTYTVSDRSLTSNVATVTIIVTA